MFLLRGEDDRIGSLTLYRAESDNLNLKCQPHFYCFFVPPQFFNSVKIFSSFSLYAFCFYLGFFLFFLSVSVSPGSVEWKIGQTTQSLHTEPDLFSLRVCVCVCGLHYFSRVSSGVKAGPSNRRVHLIHIQSDYFSV